MILLTDAQLAERWGLSVKRLANDRSAGRGPRFVKLGDGLRAPVRYPLEIIEEYELARLRSSTAEHSQSQAAA